MSDVVILEPNQEHASAVKDLLETRGISCIVTTTIDDTQNKLTTQDVSLIVVPTGNTQLDGIEFYAKALAQKPKLKVIFLADKVVQEDMLRALRLKAHDFLPKPLNPTLFLKSVDRALQEIRATKAPASVVAADTPPCTEWIRYLWVGNTSSSRTMKSTVQRYCANDCPIHLAGGSPKERKALANFIHNSSKIAEQRFLWQTAMCSDTIKDLLLNRYSGTLCIEDIEHLSEEAQYLITRRLHNNHEYPLRVITAGADDASELCNRKEWDGKLALMLAMNTIEIPTLSPRHADLPEILEVLIPTYFKNGEPRPNITPKAYHCLVSFDWKSFVELDRELRKIFRNFRGAEITPLDLPTYLAADVDLPNLKSFLAEQRIRYIADIHLKTKGNRSRMETILGEKIDDVTLQAVAQQRGISNSGPALLEPEEPQELSEEVEVRTSLTKADNSTFKPEILVPFAANA